MLRCPFHEDKNASLSIHSGEGVWNCKGCSEKGNIQQLWAQVKRIPLREAGTEIAAIYGVNERAERPPSRTDLTRFEEGLDHELATTYLVAHAIPIQFAKDQGIGFDGKNLTIPVRDRTGKGLLVLKKRNLSGEGPKSHNPRGRGIHLFPLWLWNSDEPTVICEGESDALALHAIGVNALTSTGGVGALTAPVLADYIKSGESVTICLDADDAGREGARKLSEGLRKAGRAVSVFDLGSGDIGDMLKGVPVAERRAAWDMLKPAELPEAPTIPAEEPYELNEYGNGRRFAHMHGDDVRWISELRDWMFWNRNHWSADHSGEIERRGHAVLAAILDESRRSYDSGDDATGDELFKLVRNTGGRSRFAGMLTFAKGCLSRSREPISSSINLFHQDSHLLPVENGMVDLRTGELSKHEPSNYNDRVVHLKYDPEAECPLWEETILEVLAESDGTQDPETVAYFQRLVGYCLTGSVDEDAMFLLYGTGANGKSMILEILSRVLGPFYRATDFRVFLDKGVGGAVDYHKSQMRGARVISASEVGDEQKMDEALLKSLTGRDEVTARDPYGKPFSFEPTHKIIMSVNHRPRIAGGDPGIWRRMHLIPFEVSFDPNSGGRKPDRSRPKRLLAELSGILTWAVQGAIAWHELKQTSPSGLNPTRRCKVAVGDYQDDMDETGGFLGSWIQKAPGKSQLLKAIYDAYATYCTLDDETPISKRRFGTKLRESGIRVKKSNGHTRVNDVELTMEAQTVIYEAAESKQESEKRW
tara:strand:- start:4612 stop:6894 length:2283 start_codon:yes stop_codon:yes gene_type:complete